MAARTSHPSRLMTLVVFLGLLVAGCTSDDAGPADIAPTTLAASSTTSSELDATPGVSSPEPVTSTITTARLTLDAPVPGGNSVIVPEGPYISNQQVTLLFPDDMDVDLLNGSPRLCARVNNGAEICDPTRLHSQVLLTTPDGTNGVTVGVPQRYFGPGGEADCGDDAVQCRFLWLADSGPDLTSPILSYSGELKPSPLTLEATLGPDVGVATVHLRGSSNLNLADLVSPQVLESFEDSVNRTGVFDSERLEVRLQIGALCAFGSGSPPIGTEALMNPPDWWQFNSSNPLSHQYNCDWLAVDGELDSDGSGSATILLQRNTHGNGGWRDCAVDTCYLEVMVSWTHPLPDGSMLGDETAASRVLIEMPETWPSTRPSIRIVEPGPYEPGQEVTVEVRDYPYGANELSIAWCSSGEYSCSYRFGASTVANGVHQFAETVRGSIDNCGANRCYFAIDSQSKGTAPPAIVIVPMVD